jgi:hypothetical protein
MSAATGWRQTARPRLDHSTGYHGAMSRTIPITKILSGIPPGPVHSHTPGKELPCLQDYDHIEKFIATLGTATAKFAKT